MGSPSRARRRRQLRNAARCPDCDSNVRVVSDNPLHPISVRLQVAHDDTCPWWRRHGSKPLTTFVLAPPESSR